MVRGFLLERLMEHKLFFLPGKPEPEDHGDGRSPYDMTDRFPIGTQVLYPSGRVYMLKEAGLYEDQISEYRWAGFVKGQADKISPYLKMYALLEGIELRV